MYEYSIIHREMFYLYLGRINKGQISGFVIKFQATIWMISEKKHKLHIINVSGPRI